MSSKIIKKEFKAKKYFGQNFLKDPNIANKIVELSLVNNNTTVIEVGPGMGSLTIPLLEKAKEVIVYEIDKDIVPILEENTKEYTNLKIIAGDDLKEDISWINDIDGEVISVSNLPYYITSPIISKFLDEAKNIKRMYFMVQKEVAERISAKVGTKDYNAFSILTQYEADTKTVLNVKRTSFSPAPNVDRAIIEIKRKDNQIKPHNEELFKKIVYQSFKERRKTLLNNLSAMCNKEELQDLLNKVNIDSSLRAESLSIDDFINLSNAFEELLWNM